ncbi:MAG: acyltransferase family protein, partial [Lachnospiraceae bacterium]|nr:acyltransferase family protein [Lachnospiraceae bacterium]
MSVHHAKRIDFIDLLEFLAMTLVLLYHCTTYDFNILESASVSVLLGYYFRAILSAGVPLFFFANGYLLFSRESILEKHVHKTIRLIILTVIWGFINVLLLMPIEGQQLSGREIIRTVWSWKSGWINHFWFLGVLICLHFIFPVLK